MIHAGSAYGVIKLGCDYGHDPKDDPDYDPGRDAHTGSQDSDRDPS